MAGSAAAGMLKWHIPGAARIDPRAQATPIRLRGAVGPDPDPAFDEEPLGGEKEGGSDGAGDRPTVGQSSPPVEAPALQGWHLA